MAEGTHEEKAESTQAQDAAPAAPTRLPARSWTGVVKRTISEFRADNVTDWAAALTYYAILAIFPSRKRQHCKLNSSCTYPAGTTIV